ncbi:methyltransferase domain-containing protein [Stappia sp. F7233]|uniref:Methyltransferase domain-containing protein n=1 Tax=Stappia albiluteola TaxID=2758565 RepID=A0A839A9Q1_9HYPH|nr:methyltransferase domain-containing protein [Stappia albiluteola]MBA5775916.1 methyltransferase domain-containing protein [Stappia albiluteola]
MSGFSSEWLASREPVDQRARNVRVRDGFLDHLRASTKGRVPHLVDLGSGTGSSLRALAPAIGGPQHWTLTDHDPALLALAKSAAEPFADCRAEVRQADLAADLAAALPDDADAVTTSAFLDLVSERWLGDLIAVLAKRRLPFLAMLTYDGRAGAAPAHPFDETVRQAMNRHQKTDKGFGPALGPDAAARAVSAFAEAGFLVIAGASDWRALAAETAFQTMLVEGWAQAAREIGEDEASIAAWQEDRLSRINAQGLTTLVGHLDFAALPAI